MLVQLAPIELVMRNHAAFYVCMAFRRRLRYGCCHWCLLSLLHELLELCSCQFAGLLWVGTLLGRSLLWAWQRHRHVVVCTKLI